MSERLAFRIGLLIAALSCCGMALGQTPQATSRMYKCTDAKGKTYYTQTPPKECQGITTQELSRQGTVTKQHEVLTPEQMAAREAERKKKAEQDRIAGEERRKNTALLNTYASEKDIEEARARALKQAQDQIVATEKNISEAEKRRQAFEKEKEFYVKKQLPQKLQSDIQNNEITIKNQRELLDAKKKEIGSINARYDDDKRRYVELTRATARK
jgi:hypothetical protein